MKSNYSIIYINNEKAGKNYDNKINNKFECFIFDLEKLFLGKVFNKIQGKDKMYMDFACGTGRIIQFISSKYEFNKYTGIDLSENMINEARRTNNSKITFKVLDITNSKANIPKQDIITSFRLFLNLEEKNRYIILKKLNSIMKKDGYLIVNNHLNRYSILGLTAFILHKIFHLPIKGQSNPKNKRTILNTLKNSEFKEVIESCGFKVIREYHFCLLPGYKNYIFFTKLFLFKIEIFISKLKFLNFFGKDCIFVCKKVKNL